MAQHLVPHIEVSPTETPVCFQLADALVPMEIKPGISLATVSAVLHTKDNKHVLQVRGRVSWACTPELPLGPGKMRNPPDRPHQWCSHSSQHKAETRLLNGLDWKQNTRVRSSLLFPWPHASETETVRAAIIPRAGAAHHPRCSSRLRKDPERTDVPPSSRGRLR